MEPRIAAIETDIRNIKENVAKLFDGMKTANDAITKLSLQPEVFFPGAHYALREGDYLPEADWRHFLSSPPASHGG